MSVESTETESLEEHERQRLERNRDAQKKWYHENKKRLVELNRKQLTVEVPDNKYCITTIRDLEASLIELYEGQ